MAHGFWDVLRTFDDTFSSLSPARPLPIPSVTSLVKPSTYQVPGWLDQHRQGILRHRRFHIFTPAAPTPELPADASFSMYFLLCSTTSKLLTDHLTVTLSDVLESSLRVEDPPRHGYGFLSATVSQKTHHFLFDSSCWDRRQWWGWHEPNEPPSLAFSVPAISHLHFDRVALLSLITLMCSDMDSGRSGRSALQVIGEGISWGT